ncbi:hypothetical protein [Mesorhizobium carmichaelinearum]|uniref:hypothetical protein n=1 Tax=Mesorhizobium carmichaelinearum TaxID=1208188 RepID=UPI000BA49A90|nr:hypothetical protein [Mesorhizobium carmichaelinearum]
MTSNDLSDLELIWGAPTIARAVNLNQRQTYYALESGHLPAQKVGSQWVTSKSALRQYFASLLPGEAA